MKFTEREQLTDAADPKKVQPGKLSPAEEKRIVDAKRLAYYKKMGVGSKFGRR